MPGTSLQIPETNPTSYIPSVKVLIRAIGVQLHRWEGKPYALDDFRGPFHHVATWNGHLVYARWLHSHIVGAGVSGRCNSIDYGTAGIVTLANIKDSAVSRMSSQMT
jgi:hypothetical protein